MTLSESLYTKLVEEIFVRFPSVQKNTFAESYKPGLERMEAFCEALGHPERGFRSIHVAGTNGKGSVCNMLASALSAAGLKTGLYTSPHIVDFRERARIIGGPFATGFPGEGEGPVEDGRDLVSGDLPLSGQKDRAEMVPKEYVFDFLTAWKPYFVEHKLSFFEITTGLAFKWFADSAVDVAVIETGLGGRLDSTNVLTPDLSVITSIGLDHCALLGDTLAEIAAEKAGIMKPGVPCLIGESLPETGPVFEETAWMRCPLTFAEKVRPSLWYRHGEILRNMDLQGGYQEKNLRTVLAAVDILKEMSGFKGLSDTGAVLDGIQRTAHRMDFRGRWERLSTVPQVICDIGHNPPALRCNFAQLNALLEEGKCSSLIIVYGVMADKDIDSIFPLMPADATWFFTAPDTPRALPAGELARKYKAFCAANGRSVARIYETPSVREAVRMAVMLSQDLDSQTSRSASALKPVPSLVYIGGSTFVVAEAIPLF